MIRVMIVDDHAVLRDGIALVFQLEKDMEVVAQAGTAEEVRRKVPIVQPDILLMDIHLQEESGIELTRFIRDEYPDMKVLMLTIEDEEMYLKQALQAGASGYLLKETSSEELIHGVRNVYKGYCVIPPSMTAHLLTDKTGGRHTKKPSTLTQREQEVLQELVKGFTNKEIAHSLFISDKTVKIHISNIYRKLQVKSRSQAILYAVRNQLLLPIESFE
ncbi:response regulator transcription factor [Halobacillus sp. ACCC02827]|uniref:response regulator n=1 Tax=Bacillaceae TaxID=186817 RepID=UPI0002A506C5|nr:MULTISPECIES: response regulator transcription factor [Bacillaceae]ELK48031.1 two-component response regulator [Halobacillus sp. BAB-2008]QHT45661.1 response regulator transcription factor [Bacillus sp. SB49]WJE16460.1 response regulator transcription factor [Halobacillus sp. ACCC02827]